MVVGNGMIARGFNQYRNAENILIYASGVANSKANSTTDFKRETELLRVSWEQNKQSLLVYFSTCSINDPEESDSPYVRHKLSIENWIQKLGTPYLICRVSNVVGFSKNESTVINYLFNHLRDGRFFELWENAHRNIIDIDDVSKIADFFISNPLYHNRILNIANPNSYRVTNIVKEIESFLNKESGNYRMIEKGHYFAIEIPEVEKAIAQLLLEFNCNYVNRILTKYFTL